MAIDKQTASTLYGYSYKLKDSEGNVWNVDGVHAGKLILHLKGKRKVIGCSFDKIGTTYKILARPLEMLTKEIEGKVPIVELAKIVCPYHPSEITEVEFEADEDYTWVNLIKGGVVIYCLRYQNGNFYVDDKDDDRFLNQYLLFQKLHEWHFNIGFPENTTTDLI